MVSYRIISPVLGLMLVMLSVAACGVLQPTPIPIPTAHTRPTRTAQLTPRMIEHPQPTLTIDAGIFRTSDSPVIERECDARIHPSDMYGGLEPNYPVAACLKDWASGDECLRESGGIVHICERVIVYLDGTFQLIGTQQELRELFAPIESPEEALSYALLATGYSAKYEADDYRLALGGNCDPGPQHYRYYTDVLEATHVVEVVNGYEINLFDSQVFGCAPHPVWSVPIQVYHDGGIVEGPKKKLFEEDMSGLTCCVD
jgi:hypothetical protein